MDFIYLNTMGYMCYTAYNVAFLTSSSVREEYARRNGGAEPVVRWNDAAFAGHALLLSSLTFAQTKLYKKSDQRVSRFNWFMIWFFVLIISTASFAAFSWDPNSDFWTYHWLDTLYLLSYIKLYISFGKYVPQAHVNFVRKSTVGWSIHNILLDFTGGVLSIIQLILDSAAANDNWKGIRGNPVKLLLGLLTLAFDLLFMTQHFILYPDKEKAQDQEAQSENSEETPLLH